MKRVLRANMCDRKKWHVTPEKREVDVGSVMFCGGDNDDNGKAKVLDIIVITRKATSKCLSTLVALLTFHFLVSYIVHSIYIHKHNIILVVRICEMWRRRSSSGGRWKKIFGRNLVGMHEWVFLCWTVWVCCVVVHERILLLWIHMDEWLLLLLWINMDMDTERDFFLDVLFCFYTHMHISYHDRMCGWWRY